MLKLLYLVFLMIEQVILITYIMYTKVKEYSRFVSSSITSVIKWLSSLYVERNRSSIINNPPSHNNVIHELNLAENLYIADQ